MGFFNPVSAWSFQNLRYCLGLSKPPLLSGILKTSAIAWGSQNPAIACNVEAPVLPICLFPIF